jgi:hypothetical protein
MGYDLLFTCVAFGEERLYLLSETSQAIISPLQGVPFRIRVNGAGPSSRQSFYLTAGTKKGLI